MGFAPVSEKVCFPSFYDTLLVCVTHSWQLTYLFINSSIHPWVLCFNNLSLTFSFCSAISLANDQYPFHHLNLCGVKLPKCNFWHCSLSLYMTWCWSSSWDSLNCFSHSLSYIISDPVAAPVNRMFTNSVTSVLYFSFPAISSFIISL